MNEFSISSTNLLGGRYDEETRELTIEFASGGTYVYSGVPIGVVEELQSSSSPGRFFYRQIRNLYPYRKES